jgi:hypothetical protein
MDRAIVGLLSDEGHKEIRGITARRAKGYRDKARANLLPRAGEVLSVTQPDIAVVRANLLGWHLAWPWMSLKPDLSFTI